MPIRYFNLYVKEMKLIQETRLSALADTRLGVEGHGWLRQLLGSIRNGEPVAIGGFPLALEAEIVKELAFFKKNKITPIFVFSGLSIARRDSKPFANDSHRPAHRNAAWETYWQKHVEQAMRGWSSSVSQTQEQADMIPFVMQVLHAHGVEFMRAPYSSWGQLAYLYKHESQPIHAIYASSDVLMFDVDRVITSINASKSTFSWVLKDNLLTNFGIGSDQFLDMCILAGFEWCPTFPALDTEIGFSFKSAIDVIRHYRTGFNAIQAYADHPVVKSTNYVDNFCRTYCAIKYHIALHLDGSVGPLSPEYAPSDLHEIIGYRLPSTAYQLLARGIIHPPMLNMLASGTWAEFPPLDNGESEEYRSLVAGWVREQYTQDCAALCTSLGPFFKQRKIAMRTWIDPQSELVLHEVNAPRAAGAENAAISTPGAASVPPASDLAAVLQRSRDLLSSSRTDSSNSQSTSGSSSSQDTELVLSALTRLGFILRDGQHTKLGCALAAGLRALQDSSQPPSTQWALVAAAVLLDRGLLSGEKWSVAYEDSSSPVGDAKQQKYVRLISRIATLVPMAGRTGPWRLALNRDLLAFNSAVKLVYRTLASSIESACLVKNASSSALSPARVSKLLELKSGLPLDGSVSDASGLLAHALLADHVRNGEGSWDRIQEAAGNSVDNPKAVLGNVWSLVGAVVALAKDYSSPNAGSKKPAGKTGKATALSAASDMKSAYEWARPIFNKALK
ncbi:PIN domain-like protein [Martensiomyces pterosporus]|nr:PIN domain-like protein [Martensiomyces pterosporus]